MSHQCGRELARTDADRCNGVVAISGLLAELFMLPRTVEACNLVTDAAQQTLGLDAKSVGWVLERIKDVMPDTDAMFGMELAHDPAAIVAQAQELLTIIRARLRPPLPAAYCAGQDQASREKPVTTFQGTTHPVLAAAEHCTGIIQRGWWDE